MERKTAIELKLIEFLKSISFPIHLNTTVNTSMK